MNLFCKNLAYPVTLAPHKLFRLSIAILGVTVFGQALALSECTVRVQPVVFGPYDPLAPTPLDNSSGSVEVICRALTPGSVGNQGYSIALSAGFSGGFNPRTLREVTRGLAGASLDYNLYTSPGRQIIWGNGVAPSVVVGGTLSLPAQNVNVSTGPLTIYSTINAGQRNKPGGAYSDIVQVTVSY
jgi:spore coat protein U-like protein